VSRRLTAVAIVLVIGACSSPPAVTPAGVTWPVWEPARELPATGARPDGRPGTEGGTILRSASAAIASGTPYRFGLEHCGLLSPIDVDGSFWEPIDGVAPDGRPIDLAVDSEMINATTGIIVVIGDEARFRTDSGSVIRLERAGVEMEFPGCD
jgi:hypothetical protein